MTDRKRNLLLLIHNSLHSNVNQVCIDGQSHPVQIHNSQTSSIKFEDKVLIKQNSTSSGLFGRLAKAGHHVTIIARSGKKWGVIVDQEIWDPEDGD